MESRKGFFRGSSLFPSANLLSFSRLVLWQEMLPPMTPSRSFLMRLLGGDAFEIGSMITPQKINMILSKKGLIYGWRSLNGLIYVNVNMVIWVVATQIFLDFSPRKLGKMNPIWRSYFSKGLKPPTRGLHLPKQTYENGPLEKDILIGNHHFQVPCWISGVYFNRKCVFQPLIFRGTMLVLGGVNWDPFLEGSKLIHIYGTLPETNSKRTWK